jgi:hypothetical protein
MNVRRVHFAEHRGELRGDLETAIEVLAHLRLDPAPQRQPRNVLEHERNLPFVPYEVASLHGTLGLERAQQLELVAVASKLSGGDHGAARTLDDDACPVRGPAGPVYGRRAAVVNGLTALVARKLVCLLCHCFSAATRFVNPFGRSRTDATVAAAVGATRRSP